MSRRRVRWWPPPPRRSSRTGATWRASSRLLETGSSSTEASEKLETTRAQLDAQLAQNRAQALAAERQLAVLEAQIAQSEAAIAAQRAALDAATLNLGYTTITATQDGVIGQRQVKPGQLVGVGSQITTLTPLPNVWVIANYKETQLTHMAVGQKAEITVDTFPGHTLRGHVLAFAPASGAEFALLPPDNATGNFTKVVQRIAVKIVIDDADGLADRLVPGMSVEAKVDARDGGTDERGCASARFRLDRADAAVAADLHPVARSSRRAHGHVHLDFERPAVDVRACRHPRRRRCRIRRGRMDHHGADHRPDARHAPGGLDGRRLRPAASVDRRLHGICGHFAADPVFVESAHATGDAVSRAGWHRDFSFR